MCINVLVMLLSIDIIISTWFWIHVDIFNDYKKEEPINSIMLFYISNTFLLGDQIFMIFFAKTRACHVVSFKNYKLDKNVKLFLIKYRKSICTHIYIETILYSKLFVVTTCHIIYI